jgi:prepilin-type N-terminal cleavage/methylation domain-containing protein
MMQRTSLDVDARIRGYTLFEMICVIAVMGIAINLCAGLFMSGARLSALGTENLDRINAIGDIEAAFRKTVRESEGVIPVLGEHQSGKDRLVLQMPPIEGQPRWVVLGALRDPMHLSRLEIVERDGVYEARSFTTYRQKLEQMEFDFASGGPVRLNVMIWRDPTEGKRPGMNHGFLATPRGISGGVGLTLASRSKEIKP